jgi:hypothetical protein
VERRDILIYHINFLNRDYSGDLLQNRNILPGGGGEGPSNNFLF